MTHAYYWFVGALMVAGCKDHVPAERLEAQVKLLKTTCECLKVPNGCDSRICADRAKEAFGESPKGWGNTAEADTWGANERSISKCMRDIIDSTASWHDAENLKWTRHVDYHKRFDTGCT